METRNFKTATFGGFDKQDVLDVFEQLSREHKEQTEELQRQINQLKSKKFELSSEFEKYRAGEKQKTDLINKLQLLIKKQNADNDKLKQLNLAVEKHAKEIRSQNQELKSQNQELAEQNELLTTQLSTLKESTETSSKRVKAIEDSGYTAERILSEANARSAATLADANKRASTILTEAAKKAAHNIEDSTRRADEIVRKAESEADRVKHAAQEYNQQAKKRLNDLASEISEREKRAAIKSGETIREANMKASEIVKTAKTKLSKANDQYHRFNKDLVNLKLSLQELLQDIAVKVDSLDEDMPEKIEIDWLSDSLIPDNEFEQDEMLREELIATQQEEESPDTKELEQLDVDLEVSTDETIEQFRRAIEHNTDSLEDSDYNIDAEMERFHLTDN